ncbi:MAG: hypothetical protein PHO29_07125 [Acetobacterium sp.]|nr:hypothetical protein [Acetobacterium sp.]
MTLIPPCTTLFLPWFLGQTQVLISPTDEAVQFIAFFKEGHPKTAGQMAQFGKVMSADQQIIFNYLYENLQILL